MNLNQLLHFCAVARTGSYTRAAEEANISEPVVHQAVRSLEKNCGLKLLQRKGKRIYPTREGEIIFEYATRIASLAEMTEQAVAEQKGDLLGKLSIGVSMAVMVSFLPAVLPQWKSAHPFVDLFISLGQPHELQEQLLDNRLDLLIAAGSNWAPGLRRSMVFSDKLVVLSAPNHPLAGRVLVTIGELSREKIILAPRGSSLRTKTDELQYEYRIQFKVAVEVNRTYAVGWLCRAGLGIAILPMSTVLEEVEHGRLVVLNVEAFPIARPYWLVYRLDKVLSHEMKSFLHAIQLWIQGNEPSGSITRRGSQTQPVLGSPQQT